MVMDGDVGVLETDGRTDYLSPSPNVPDHLVCTSTAFCATEIL
jgi:hypothetical protein